MSVILLPRRFRQQPQYPARLDPSHPLSKDLVLAYSAGRGLHDAKHGFGSTVGTMLQGAGQKGRYIQPSDGSSYAQFASLDDYNTLGEVTVAARIRTSSLGSQQALVIKSESGGGTNTPFGLLIESDGSVSLNRATSTGGASFRVWASAAKLSANTDYVIVASQGGDISVGPAFYINGIPDSGAPSSLYSGNGSGPPAATAQSVKLGNRTDLASRFLGGIYDALVFKRVLSAPEIADLSRNIWSIWKAPERRIFIASAASAHDLTAASVTQTNAAAQGAITQTHALTGAGSAQANAVTAGSISQGLSLVADNAAQANTTSTASITQVHSLSASSDTQSNAATSGAVTQAHALTGSASAQSNTASTGAVTQGAQFAADSVTQANTAGTGAITQAHALTVAGSTQPNTASVASIAQSHTLTGQGATQANVAASGAISTGVVHNLAASQSTQANTGSTSAITQAHVLVLAPSIQDNIAAASAIVQAHVLAALSVTQGNSASSGAITAGDNVLVSIVERTAIFRRSKSVTVRFN